VTAPIALTGVGAAIPFAVSVGGQVATETVVYGVSDFFTGRKAEANSDRTTPLEAEPLTEEQAESISEGLTISLLSKGNTSRRVAEQEAQNANTRSTTVDEKLQAKIAENKKASNSKAKAKASLNNQSSSKVGTVTSSKVGTVTSSKTSRSRTNSAVTVTRQTGNFGKSKYTGNTIKRKIIIKKPKRTGRTNGGSRKITYTKS
jgi:hypothetical protein